MKRKRTVSQLTPVLILAGLAAGLWAPGRPLAAPDVPLDSYGYTYSTASELWVEADTGTLLTFPSQDDSYSGPLNIGFNFRFYEHTYSTLYVSTNGLVTFGLGSLGLQPRLYPIPWAPAPNTLIAPMWSNLNMTYGKVYLRTVGVSPSKSTVVEWEIYDRDPADAEAVLTLNFELVLYENNGDILFQYQVLDGMPVDHAVGIEDDLGLSGLQYLSALVEGTDIRFIRPAPGARVKVLPRLQGSFAYGLKAQYRLRIENNGDLGADSFNLAAGSSAPGWQAKFYDQYGQTLISKTETVAQGGAITVTLKVQAPPTALPGDFTNLVYTATSTLNPTRWMTGTVQSAVPVQFAQVYVDGARGIRLGQFFKENFLDRSILNSYPGASLSMEAISTDNYLVAWETGQSALSAFTDFFTDIRYKVANRFGGTSAELLLTNNAQVVLEPDVSQADARSLAIAPAPDGRVGVAWSLLKYRPHTSGGIEINSNIYFAILNGAGTRLSGRQNVTLDSGWFTGGHSYESPNVAVTGDGRYVVCWIDRFSVGAGVRCAIHTFDGQHITPITTVPVDTIDPTANSLGDLSLATLMGNRVLTAYNEYYPDTSKVLYAVLNSTGSMVSGPNEVTGADGVRPHAVQFANGNILLAWIEQDGRVAYSYLDPNSGYSAGAPQVLSHLSGRAAESLSVTLVPGGQAVLTWVDDDDQDYMYYAVLDQDQILVTPPLVFLSSPFGDPQYQTSVFGFGNAGYLGVFQRNLPIVQR